MNSLVAPHHVVRRDRFLPSSTPANRGVSSQWSPNRYTDSAWIPLKLRSGQWSNRRLAPLQHRNYTRPVPLFQITTGGFPGVWGTTTEPFTSLSLIPPSSRHALLEYPTVIRRRAPTSPNGAIYKFPKDTPPPSSSSAPVSSRLCGDKTKRSICDWRTSGGGVDVARRGWLHNRKLQSKENE